MANEKEEIVVGSFADFAPLATVEYVTIPGIIPGKSLRIGSLSAGDFIVWSEAKEGDSKRLAGLHLIAKSLVGPEPENKRYADNNPGFIEMLRTYRHKDTERIIREILKLNGFNVKQQEEAKKD